VGPRGVRVAEDQRAFVGTYRGKHLGAPLRVRLQLFWFLEATSGSWGSGRRTPRRSRIRAPCSHRSRPCLWTMGHGSRMWTVADAATSTGIARRRAA